MPQSIFGVEGPTKLVSKANLHGRLIDILLLEDNELDAALVDGRLQDLSRPARLTRVETRAAFETALVERRWDIILADYNVPSFDGRESLALSRRQTPTTPFVFVSGAIGEELAVELFRQGATDYVLKERLDRLVPSIERAIQDAEARLERRRAETALRESEETLKTLMSNMPGMAFRCAAGAPWTFHYVSAGARELTGYRADELSAGRGWADLVHADDRELLDGAMNPSDPRRQRTLRYRIRTRDGLDRWVWDRAVAIFGDEGELLHLEGFATDVTQQVHAEMEMKKRVDFEQQLIGIVSHDLRNPLNVIMLAANTAVRSEDASERVTRLLVKIQAAGDRAARMIGDLLDFTQSRLGGGILIAPRRVNLRELVEQVVDEAETTHPGRRIEVAHSGDLDGEWDFDRLSQALQNLVVNAMKHSPPGSPVSVRTRRTEDGVELTVHNQGEPIPDTLRPRLFQPMQRGSAAFDRASRSVGLGLYIVDQIVRRHGGHIEVESCAERGTSFRIELPLVAVPTSIPG